MKVVCDEWTLDQFKAFCIPIAFDAANSKKLSSLFIYKKFICLSSLFYFLTRIFPGFHPRGMKKINKSRLCVLPDYVLQPCQISSRSVESLPNTTSNKYPSIYPFCMMIFLYDLHNKYSESKLLLNFTLIS